MINLRMLFVTLLAILAANVFAAEPLKGNPGSGKTKTMVCGGCHGVDGNSLVPMFPKLAGQGEKYLLKQLLDIKEGRRPIPTMMGQLDSMSEQDLADIASYYASQDVSINYADPDKVELGEQIYRSGILSRNVAACTACHSPNGKGNAPAGFPSLGGQHPDYIATQLKMYRKGYEDDAGRTNDGDSKIMRTTAFSLSDLEIEAVSSYAAGLY